MKLLLAFSSPKRSNYLVQAAAKYALATNSELILLRIVPDPQKVGVVAQLIATTRPYDKAISQIELVVSELKDKNINASGLVKIGEVAKEIIKTAIDIKADILFLGTAQVGYGKFAFIKRDPIVRYIVDNCPINLMLIRHEVKYDSVDND